MFVSSVFFFVIKSEVHNKLVMVHKGVNIKNVNGKIGKN